jgi:hypothetical protein
MELINRLITMSFCVLLFASFATAQNHLAYVNGDIISAIPLEAVDSIKPDPAQGFKVFSGNNTITIPPTVLLFNHLLSDTICVDYHGNGVSIINPRLDTFHIATDSTNVFITATGKHPFVCRVTGNCSDGRLVIKNDTTCTLVISDLRLTSKRGSAICFMQKQKVFVELPPNTISVLNDAVNYPTDSTEIANGCFYAKGTLAFIGGGTLIVTGNHRHGISSGKNIVVEGGNIIVRDAVKDGIHCDKFTMKGGRVTLSLNHDANKGIKAKEEISIMDGLIEGEALGNITMNVGDISYCTLMKSEGSLCISGGTIALKHVGRGGRCISVDGNMEMKAGSLFLECRGDGGSYINAENDSDYYTPKCVTIDGVTHIERGRISLLATGSGGKGIDCSDTLYIGKNGDSFLPEDSLLISIETKGSALVDNISEDYRRGCPKAIKSDQDIYIYSGNLRLLTHGQGGEGIETKQSLRTYQCTIHADCYDDGINTGRRCYIDGAYIFCRSRNNDGIDSNGKMTVMDGIVAAISEHDVDECFDTNNGLLYVYGGSIIGIGNNDVIISPASTVPYFSTPSYLETDGYQHGDSISLGEDSFLSVSLDDKSVLSLHHDVSFDDAFITVASVHLHQGSCYSISDGIKPKEAQEEWLDGRVAIGGMLSEMQTLFNFKP